MDMAFVRDDVDEFEGICIMCGIIILVCWAVPGAGMFNGSEFVDNRTFVVGLMLPFMFCDVI